MGWGGNEMAPEVHCDSRIILTKGRSTSHIGIFGFIEKVNSENKDKSCLGAIPI